MNRKVQEIERQKRREGERERKTRDKSKTTLEQNVWAANYFNGWVKETDTHRNGIIHTHNTIQYNTNYVLYNTKHNNILLNTEIFNGTPYNREYTMRYIWWFWFRKEKKRQKTKCIILHDNDDQQSHTVKQLNFLKEKLNFWISLCAVCFYY